MLASPWWRAFATDVCLCCCQKRFGDFHLDGAWTSEQSMVALVGPSVSAKHSPAMHCWPITPTRDVSSVKTAPCLTANTRKPPPPATAHRLRVSRLRAVPHMTGAAEYRVRASRPSSIVDRPRHDDSTIDDRRWTMLGLRSLDLGIRPSCRVVSNSASALARATRDRSRLALARRALSPLDAATATRTLHRTQSTPRVGKMAGSSPTISPRRIRSQTSWCCGGWADDQRRAEERFAFEPVASRASPRALGAQHSQRHRRETKTESVILDWARRVALTAAQSPSHDLHTRTGEDPPSSYDRST